MQQALSYDGTLHVPPKCTPATTSLQVSAEKLEKNLYWPLKVKFILAFHFDTRAINNISLFFLRGIHDAQYISWYFKISSKALNKNTNTHKLLKIFKQIVALCKPIWLPADNSQCPAHYPQLSAQPPPSETHSFKSCDSNCGSWFITQACFHVLWCRRREICRISDKSSTKCFHFFFVSSHSSNDIIKSW